MASQPVAFPAHCTACKGAVTMQITDWPLGVSYGTIDFPSDHPSVRKAVWTCPHCQVLNIGGFPGRVATVVKDNSEIDDAGLQATAATGGTSSLLLY